MHSHNSESHVEFSYSDTDKELKPAIVGILTFFIFGLLVVTLFILRSLYVQVSEEEVYSRSASVVNAKLTTLHDWENKILQGESNISETGKSVPIKQAMTNVVMIYKQQKEQNLEKQNAETIVAPLDQLSNVDSAQNANNEQAPVPPTTSDK